MEQCETSASPSRDHPWKAATMKRRAWAQSRDSWQGPSESQDTQDQEGCSEEMVSPEPTMETTAPAEEPGTSGRATERAADRNNSGLGF